MFTLIKGTDIYRERLEPAWVCSNPNAQWLFAEPYTEHVGTDYDILYVYDDNTYKEEVGLRWVPREARKMARYDLDYDEVKSRLKKRSIFHAFKKKNKTTDDTTPTTENDGINVIQEMVLENAKCYVDSCAFSYYGLIKQLKSENCPHEEAVYAAKHCGADWNEQAVRKANVYLENIAFSYSGLIQQLKSEGFTEKEAKHGVDNCGADWHEQAVSRAKEYLDSCSFSYAGLIQQLKSEEFTAKEAKHGVDNCGADWNEQAVKKAKEYLEDSKFFREELITQLENEGFTNAQAVYGADANGSKLRWRRARKNKR